jgi:hypothetical protein
LVDPEAFWTRRRRKKKCIICCNAVNVFQNALFANHDSYILPHRLEIISHLVIYAENSSIARSMKRNPNPIKGIHPEDGKCYVG